MADKGMGMETLHRFVLVVNITPLRTDASTTGVFGNQEPVMALIPWRKLHLLIVLSFDHDMI